MSILQGRVAFVTGGAQGIGRGIALELARAGADIIIGDLNADKAQTVVAEIKTLGCDGLGLTLNVTDASSIAQAVQSALAHFPKIDILVNNAGVIQKNAGDQTTLADFDVCLDVNVKAVWQMTQALIPHFKAQGYGKIVNIASGAGRSGNSAFPAYSASKAAVINLTQSQSLALAPFDINVNALCPGLLWSPMWAEIEGMVGDKNNIESQNSFNHAVNRTPLKRPILPEDIGHAAVFFASDISRNITGQSLNIDCGAVLN